MYNNCLSFNSYFSKAHLISMVVMDYAMLMCFFGVDSAKLCRCILYNLNLYLKLLFI